MERRFLAQVRLYRPLIRTVAAAFLTWLAVAYLLQDFPMWPASRSLAVWFLIGALYTHLFEYAYHRWIMHGRVRAIRFIAKNHLTHHRVFHGSHFETRDASALEHVSGQWYLFPVALVAHFLVLRPFLESAELTGFLTGVLTHYLLFELTHWFSHVADNGFDRIVRRLPLLGWMREVQLRHHRLHHETPALDFNFVPPFAMDRLGATFLVPGDCTEDAEEPCFVPGTMRLRTPFDGATNSASDAGGHIPGENQVRPDPAEERSLP